jgi:hypothetical protein
MPLPVPPVSGHASESIAAIRLGMRKKKRRWIICFLSALSKSKYINYFT